MLGADYIRVLYVDLTKEKVSVEERKDLFHLLGGTGVAAKLLEETCIQNCQRFMRTNLSCLP